MSFDSNDYLHRTIDNFSIIATKFYVNTTARYSSASDSESDEQGDTLTALFRNISENKNTLVIGKPGLGKSTALKLMCFQQAEQCLKGMSSRIPVLIELRRLGAKSSFSEGTTTPFQLIQSKLFGAGPNNSQQVAQLLKDGELLLLLDGLNEMSSINWGLNDFLEDYPNTLVIITTREFGHEGHIEIDRTIHLQPLRDHQSRKFIQKRLKGSQTSVNGLLNLRSDKLQELLEVPLFLDMFCETYESSGQAPISIGELFRDFTKIHYPKHKPSTTVIPRSDDFFDFCHETLQGLAFLMLNADGNERSIWLQISEVKAQKWLEHIFAERGETCAASKANQWLNDAVRLHLLQQTGDEEAIEFVHQQFQEYYAAEWMLRHYEDLSDDQIKTHYFNQIKWTESVSLLIGLLRCWPKVLHILEMAASVDLTFATKLSGRVRDEFQSDAFEYVKTCLHDTISSHDTIISILKHNQTRFWADYLVAYLESPQGKRVHLVYWFNHCDSLMKINCKRTREYFRSILNEKGSSKDLDDRDKVGDALRVLSKLGDIEGIILFIVSKTPKPTAWNIERGINYLGDVRDEKHVPLLISILDNKDFDDSGLFWVIGALGEIDSETAVNKLVEIFKSEDTDFDHRNSAIGALQYSSNKKILPDMLSAVILDRGFAEPSANYIKRTDFSYGEDWLLSELKQRSTALSKFSLSLTVLLHKIADKLSPKYIGRKYAWSLDDKITESSGSQINLIIALGWLGSRKSIPLLKKLYRSPYWEIRQASIFALGRMAHPDETKFLIKALQDKDDWVRHSAIEALGWMHDPIATSTYISERSKQKNHGHDLFCRLISEMQVRSNYNPELVFSVFESGKKPYINNMVSVLWNSPQGLVYPKKLIDIMVHRMNHTDAEMGQYIYRFLSHIDHQLKSIDLSLSLKQFDKSTESTSEKSTIKVTTDRENCFRNVDNTLELFGVLYKPSSPKSDEDNIREEKRDALSRIKQVAKVDDLDAVSRYSYEQGDMDFLYSIQNRILIYNESWYKKSQQLPLLPPKQLKGSTIFMTTHNQYNFNAPVTGSAFDSKDFTINNTCLNSSEERELKQFIQAWIDQKRSEIEVNPEASGKKAAQALEEQHSSIFKKLQAGGIGATTSLMGDLATGEDPVQACIKAFFAFFGGAATA